jgi:hypothetical protein
MGIHARSLLITSKSVPTTQACAFGRAEPADVGSVSTITVNEAGRSLVGWRSTVSLQTVSGLDAAQLASTRLCVSPHPTTFVAGNPADVVRSSPCACAGPGDPNRTSPAGGAPSLAAFAIEPAGAAAPDQVANAFGGSGFMTG